jgi:hypothetical protein
VNSSHYAQGTGTSVDKTRLEIERELEKYGAKRKATMMEPTQAVVYFELHNRHVQFTMPLPTPPDLVGVKRGGKGDAARRCQQVHREKWRALLLAIKSKLISVDNQVETFEEAFLAQIVMPNGQTVSELARPALVKAYETGFMDGPGFLLPASTGGPRP